MTRRFIIALLFALTAVALIFIVYEVIERIWLQDFNTKTLYILHMGRGILSSVVAAVVMGWFIMRSSLPLLAISPSEEEWVKGIRPSDRDRFAHYIQWFIQMRWIAVVVVTLLVFVSVWIAHLLSSDVALPLILTIGVLAGSNVIYSTLLKRGVVSPYLLLAQVCGDLIILITLLHFSGGIENPLSLLMLLHVIISGIILNRRQCYTVAAIGSVLYLLLALVESYNVLGHYSLQIFPHLPESGASPHAAQEPLYVTASVVVHTALLFFTSYFVTTLAVRSRQYEKQLEVMANLADNERRLLAQSLETTSTGLRVLDQNFQPRWANKLWNQWFGNLESMTAVAEQLNGDESAAARTLHDGKVRTTELTVGDQTKGSERVQHVIRITTAALSDLNNSDRKVVELAQDVTDLKETQAQLLRAGQLAAVGELAGQVAHEVNNPIAIISAKARLLLSDKRSEYSDEIAEEINKIVVLSDRVAQIAKGLLSSSRPSGAVHRPLSIANTVRNALAMVEQRARTNGIEIVENIPSNLPMVKANAQELEQVFLNLFINSLDVMPLGGQLTISASLDRDSHANEDDYLKVEVKDSGGGVPESIRDQIFHPFFTTKEEGKGTGLGLSLCQGLIRSHGGRIEVDNIQNEGARFSVYLPIEK